MRAHASRNVRIVGGEPGGCWTGGFGRQLRAVALSPFVRQRLAMKTPREHYADLERLVDLIEAGELTPNIERTYPLHQAPDAIGTSKPDTRGASSSSRWQTAPEADPASRRADVSNVDSRA